MLGKIQSDVTLVIREERSCSWVEMRGQSGVHVIGMLEGTNIVDGMSVLESDPEKITAEVADGSATARIIVYVNA